MPSSSLLFPVFAQVALTFIMMFWTARLRFKSVRENHVPARYFKTYEGGHTLPRKLAQVTNNFHNQLETPILFYIVIAFILILEKGDALYLQLSWAFVILRLAHMIVHVSYNHVLHRLGVFFMGVLILLTMWTRLCLQVI